MQEHTIDSTWSTSTPSWLADIDLVLRDPRACRARIRNQQGLASLARAMLATTFAGAGVFGAVIGMFRGDQQIAYAAIKLPLVLLLTLAVSAPALTALNAALGRRASLQADLALVLAALARTALVLIALAPFILLLVHAHLAYHRLFLAIVASGAVAGLFGARMLIDGLRESSKRAWFAVASGVFLVFATVGPQMAWTMRPYLVRPQAKQVVLLRSHWKSLPEAMSQSARSSVGIYDTVWQEAGDPLSQDDNQSAERSRNDQGRY